MRFFIIIILFFVQCTQKSVSYQKCEKADSEYLICSLVVYQNYTFCSEFASAGSKSTEEKASDKFNCDATRIIGLSLCEDIKKNACGDSK